MRWQDLGRSSNIGSGSGGGGLAIGGLSLGGLAIAAVVYLLTGDPGAAIQASGAASGAGGGQAQVTAGCPEGDEACQFTSAILKGPEDVWAAEFPRRGATYEAPKLISYDGVIGTACGGGQSAMGPFYCPGDRTVYIDTSFYNELATKFGAAGDFANAYVIAHEVGHHVQGLTGASDQVARVRARGNERAANAASVQLELQADCYAGMWAAQANQLNIQRTGQPLLEPGEEREALAAASAIGDDKLQQQGGGRVAPDSFTHGSSEQRVRWFTTGFRTGDMDACDTFAARSL